MPDTQKCKTQWENIRQEFYERIKGLNSTSKGPWNTYLQKSNGYGYMALSNFEQGTFWLNNEDGIHRDALLQILQNAPDVNTIEDISKLKDYLITQARRRDVNADTTES